MIHPKVSYPVGWNVGKRLYQSLLVLAILLYQLDKGEFISITPKE